ncbi:hypothetical protein ABK040_003860 [Willaertia magna]
MQQSLFMCDGKAKRTINKLTIAFRNGVVTKEEYDEKIENLKQEKRIPLEEEERINDLLLPNENQSKTQIEIQHLDRCLGTLLGCCLGDILGSKLEFKPFSRLITLHEKHLVIDLAKGKYTDDSEMMIALTSCLIHKKEINAESCSKFYVKWFRDIGPMRGYGPSVSNILNGLYKGQLSYKDSATTFYKEGSYANGALMRIAPLAMPFIHYNLVKKERIIMDSMTDKDDDNEIYQAVYTVSMPTHVHIEAVDAAYLQVKSMIYLSNYMYDNIKNFNPNDFLDWIISISLSEIMKEKLNIVKELLTEKAKKENSTTFVKGERGYIMSDNYIEEINVFLERMIGNTQFGYGFQIRATDAFANVLYIFLQYYDDPIQCILRAVNMGGDADTIGAIIGALIGSLHGTKWIPKKWYEIIENEDVWGRDAIIERGRELSKLIYKENITISNEDVGYEKFMLKF